MGNTASATSLPDKNTFAHLREHPADDFPVWTQDGFDIVKVNVEELFTDDLAKLRTIGDRLIHGLSRDNIIILRNSDKSYELQVQAAEKAKEFLLLSEADKRKFSQATEEGRRLFASGYMLIHFDNRNNRRDPEWRDAYQIRLHDDTNIPWPSDSFKEVSLKYFNSQWEISVKVLHAIALSLNLNPLDLLQLVGSTSEPDPYKSTNSNLTFFHYFDKFMSYKTPQKCMIHQDHGLVTLLPKTDVSGIELLHPSLQQWIPMEQFIDDRDQLLYCGEALRRVTNSRIIPATHRVVRMPNIERNSMPFEVKPNDDAILRNLVDPEKISECTFDGMVKQLLWERIERSVNRADGIEPGSQEEKEYLEQKQQDQLKKSCFTEPLPAYSAERLKQK